MKLGSTDISKLYVGSAAATKAYIGATEVWAAAAGGFDPATLFAASEQGVWYDPSDLTTLFQNSDGTGAVTTDGDLVGYMADKSGNGHHATQATTASQPVYRTAGGLHWLEFDGVNDFMTVPAMTAVSGPLSVFVGFNKTALGQAHLFDIQTGRLIVGAKSGATNQFGVFDGSWRETTLTMDTPYVMTAVIEGTSGECRLDGTSFYSGASSEKALSGGIAIGRHYSASTAWYEGKVFSIIARNAATSTATIGDTEAYIAGKSGVTL